ncbi:MAG: sulfurtransferase TusA family protein [Desulfobacter sp.]|nr:sulfurtransferase TusA family protein [Desulfobacter sp.]MDD9303027.1 sulfurtransferase TusA family protein [Desulfobacter sp.]WDP87877.1 MAG: sulfurtransferase TusA family protein [Desulfobacter sp.]
MTAKHIVDLRGVILPLNLLKCKNCLKSMEKGDVLEVFIEDVDVVQDLRTIVKRSNDEIVYTKNRDDYICLGIKKGPRNRFNIFLHGR